MIAIFRNLKQLSWDLDGGGKVCAFEGVKEKRNGISINLQTAVMENVFGGSVLNCGCLMEIASRNRLKSLPQHT